LRAHIRCLDAEKIKPFNIPDADKVQKFVDEAVPTDWTVQTFTGREVELAQTWFRRFLKDGPEDELWDQLDAAVATWDTNGRPKETTRPVRGAESDIYLSLDPDLLS
jgi:hypothetical protein